MNPMPWTMHPWIPPWCSPPQPWPPNGPGPWISKNRDEDSSWYFSLLPDWIKELVKKEMESQTMEDPKTQVQPKEPQGLPSRSGTTLVIGTVGEPSPQSNFEVASGKDTRVEIPRSFNLDQVKLAKKDCEILAGILKNNPQEISQMIIPFPLETCQKLEA